MNDRHPNKLIIEVENLLKNNRLDQTFRFLLSIANQLNLNSDISDIYENILILSGRYHHNEDQFNDSLIDREDYLDQRDKIANEIMNYAAILADYGELDVIKADEDIESVSAINLPYLSNLQITISPGSAPPEEIEKLLAHISIVYRKMGGEGINFSLDNVFDHKFITV